MIGFAPNIVAYKLAKCMGVPVKKAEICEQDKLPRLVEKHGLPAMSIFRESIKPITKTNASHGRIKGVTVPGTNRFGLSVKWREISANYTIRVIAASYLDIEAYQNNLIYRMMDGKWSEHIVETEIDGITIPVPLTMDITPFIDGEYTITREYEYEETRRAYMDFSIEAYTLLINAKQVSLIDTIDFECLVGDKVVFTESVVGKYSEE